MPSTTSQQASGTILTAELAGLEDLSVRQLQDRFAALSGRESRSFNRDYLFKRCAWLIQELHEGGLTPEARALATELAPGTSLRARPLPSPPLTPDPKPAGHPLDPRLPPPGTVLRKEHEGVGHEITVLDEGFEYRGKPYRSLSRLAKEITGTSWNGFLWLGLTARKDKSGKEGR